MYPDYYRTMYLGVFHRTNNFWLNGEIWLITWCGKRVAVDQVRSPGVITCLFCLGVIDAEQVHAAPC